MKTPDITPAQIVSGLAALATTLVVLFKLNITAEQQAAFATAIGIIVPLAWTIADSVIRHGRANVAAAQHIQAAAEITAASSTPDAVQTPQPIQTWTPVITPPSASIGQTPPSAATVGQTPAT